VQPKLRGIRIFCKISAYLFRSGSFSVRRVFLGAISDGFSMVDQMTNFRAVTRTERVRFFHGPECYCYLSRVLLFNTDHPKSVRSKTSFTLVMVDCAAKIIRGQQNVLYKARVLIARRTGIHFLLRRSEFLGEDGTTKASFRIFILGRVFYSIRRMNILFFT
jgi:hypothetical protein